MSNRRPMYRPHPCRAEDMRIGPLMIRVLETTPETSWLAPKNAYLHRCQRCGYFVWCAP